MVFTGSWCSFAGSWRFTTPKLVTTRRSILGPPAEGRPGPSDDNGDYAAVGQSMFGLRILRTLLMIITFVIDFFYQVMYLSRAKFVWFEDPANPADQTREAPLPLTMPPGC